MSLLTPQSTTALRAAYPNLDSEYNRVRSIGDRRTFDQWLEGHLNAYPSAPEWEFLSNYAESGGAIESLTPGEGLEPVYSDVPFEQGFSEYVNSNYINPDLERDAQRRIDADRIIASYAPQLAASRNTVSSMMQRVDAQAYLAENPDVKAAWEQGGHGKTAEEFVMEHWTNNGQFEGRGSPMRQSALLGEELANNSLVQGEQLAALQAQIAARGGALTSYLAEAQSNLDVETASRLDNLKANYDSLIAGLGTYTDAERVALAKQVQDDFNALDADLDARKQSLQSEITSLQGALDANSASRRVNLETELAKLNAAQEPLNKVRLEGANALGTAVNLGVQKQQDEVTAQAARAGYIGGSSGDSMAMQRAAISGRQAAAQAVADAQTANATDVAGIAKYGASQGRELEDSISGQQFDLSKYGATQTRGLEDADSDSRLELNRFNSAETRGISQFNNRAAFDLTKFNADGTRAINDEQAAGTRSIADYGATGRKALTDMNADETRGISDAGSQRKLGYLDQDISRRLSALSLPVAAVKAEFDLKNAADEYAQSGLDRSIRNLSFFSLGQGQAPTVNPNFAPTTDNSSAYANLGAGLIGAAGNIAQANNWWSTPKQPSAAESTLLYKPGVTQPTPGITPGVAINYTPNPNIGATS